MNARAKSIIKWVRNDSVTVRLTLADGRQVWSSPDAQYVAPDHIVVRPNEYGIKEVLVDQVVCDEPFYRNGLPAC